MTSGPELAHRYRVASYWWIATELLRRNPGLELVETHPMGGFYDCLTLHGNVGSRAISIDLNSNGSIHIHPDHIHHLEDWVALTNADAHWVVKEIERTAELKPHDSAPSSNSRAITLRLIARVLNYVVNDKASWDVRMLDPTRPGSAIVDLELLEPSAPHPLSAIFPTSDLLDSFLHTSTLPKGLVPGRFWILFRDETAAAVFDTSGVAHTRESRVELKPLYARMNRNLTQTMAHALGDLLP